MGVGITGEILCSKVRKTLTCAFIQESGGLTELVVNHEANFGADGIPPASNGWPVEAGVAGDLYFLPGASLPLPSCASRPTMDR